MHKLPEKLYRVDSVVRLEQIAIDQYGISAYELMTRAGEAVFEVIKLRYPKCKNILVLCGAGNNAGDGYVIARLAKTHGLNVRVISLIDSMSLVAEALTAYIDWTETGQVSQINTGQKDRRQIYISAIEQADIIVDALLGTGLKRPLSERWLSWVEAVNDSSKPVVSVDIPSGLYADTGATASDAIQADTTVSFIGLKQGMFTAQANDYCGEIFFSDLGLPSEIYSLVRHDAQQITTVNYSLLTKRKASSHKGCFGHVLIAGGNVGMPGAVILAARAALRTGAGLVTIVSNQQNLEAISNAVPEAMIKVCTDRDEGDTGVASVKGVFQQAFVDDVTHVAIGMGLGQDDWSLSVLQQCLRLKKPLLIDADGLNLLAKYQHLIPEILATSLTLTPHPGEASRLLSTAKINSASDIQNDRFSAVKKIYDLFQNTMLNPEVETKADTVVDTKTNARACAVILKGSGTLIFDGELLKICRLGNAAMAAPGMGDVLSGIIIALQAQGFKNSGAAEQGVCLHAAAAQHIVGDRTRGLLASDVVDKLSNVLQ